MGSTPKYALPFPELTDPANPPADIRALAEGTEYLLAAVPISLPAAQTKYHSADQIITLTPDNSAAPGGEIVTMKNPSSAANLFARITVNGWATVAYPSNLTIKPMISGATNPTNVFRSVARLESLTSPQTVYRDFFAEWDVYIAKGLTCSFRVDAHKGGTGKTTIRYTSLSIMAVSYTMDSLPVYPDQD